MVEYFDISNIFLKVSRLITTDCQESINNSIPINKYGDNFTILNYDANNILNPFDIVSLPSKHKRIDEYAKYLLSQPISSCELTEIENTTVSSLVFCLYLCKYADDKNHPIIYEENANFLANMMILYASYALKAHRECFEEQYPEIDYYFTNRFTTNFNKLAVLTAKVLSKQLKTSVNLDINYPNILDLSFFYELNVYISEQNLKVLKSLPKIQIDFSKKQKAYAA